MFGYEYDDKLRKPRRSRWRADLFGYEYDYELRRVYESMGMGKSKWADMTHIGLLGGEFPASLLNQPGMERNAVINSWLAILTKHTHASRWLDILTKYAHASRKLIKELGIIDEKGKIYRDRAERFLNIFADLEERLIRDKYISLWNLVQLFSNGNPVLEKYTDYGDMPERYRVEVPFDKKDDYINAWYLTVFLSFRNPRENNSFNSMCNYIDMVLVTKEEYKQDEYVFTLLSYKDDRLPSPYDIVHTQDDSIKLNFKLRDNLMGLMNWILVGDDNLQDSEKKRAFVIHYNPGPSHFSIKSAMRSASWGLPANLLSRTKWMVGYDRDTFVKTSCSLLKDFEKMKRQS